MTITQSSFMSGTGEWQERLAHVVATVREISEQTDPQAMVRTYRARMRNVLPTDRTVSLSRRGLTPPNYCITRASIWPEEPNPWKEKSRLPVYDRGLLGDLIYGDQPRIIDDIDLADDDPAREHLEGMGSLIALPLYDKGVSMNMVVLMRKERAAFDREQFPDWVLTGNLFGRATHNLVLADEVKQAYQAVDRELEVVAEMQRALLPAELPQMPAAEWAAHYQTSRRAGGDYYDFFELPDGKWGVLIADVSGHGTPAAVLMAITQSIARSHPGPPMSPAGMLHHLNHRLAGEYTAWNGTFVTAFYAVYDPATRDMKYASAGHHPPRIKGCGGGAILALDEAQNLPLGIDANERFDESSHRLHSSDQLVLFTDGITEASNPDGDMFGLENLDRVLSKCTRMASGLIQSIVTEVNTFTNHAPPDDDRTVLVAKLQ